MANHFTPAAPGPVTAVLGPTNTGKTHLAVERMLAHKSGVIGLPLRLLAREIYDRVVGLRGAGVVALVTGEEKIIPPEAAYYVCTVEAMPMERRFAFVAIDEIQLAADPERGHVFTDRLLNARGSEETMLLGAETMRGLIRRLLPGVAFRDRTRFSTLTYAGPRKLNRLPRRSAVVAFSAADVYSVAEMVRRQRGGAAVVMGALSPRTRNAQVAMFEAGEVDYLVATDAIGMGLNLNLDHVAFARLHKFDGRQTRPLQSAEVGQIAGRAGRHMNDGTFGVTAECGEPDIEVIERVEAHHFKPLRVIYWRNGDLDLSSPTALKLSLEAPPPGRFRKILDKPRESTDLAALKSLLQDPTVLQSAKGGDATQLLWQVCQIPDFRMTMAEAHVRLLGRLYGHLVADAKLPTDWVAGHLARLDRSDGDIDTLSARLAHIRTWTFISHRADWLEDAGHWQARAREIEDRLSDAVHDRLTRRFVDQRTAVLMRRMSDNVGEALPGGVAASGEVSVEGHSVGHIEGFRFNADTVGEGRSAVADDRTLRSAAGPIVAQELNLRTLQLEQSLDGEFEFAEAGKVFWRRSPVAVLARGRDLYRPGVTLLANELDEAGRRRIVTRLESWLGDHVRQILRPLMALDDLAQNLSGAARGLTFQLYEKSGVLARNDVAGQVRELTPADRQRLRKSGVRLGQYFVYLPAMLKPHRTSLCGALWAVHHHGGVEADLVPPGRVSLVRDGDIADNFYLACGFARYGPRVVRVDMIERLADRLREIKGKAITPDHTMLSLVGCNRQEFSQLMAGLGYRVEGTDDDVTYTRRRPPGANKKSKTGKKNQSAKKPRAGNLNNPAGRSAAGRGRQAAARPVDPDSPFAILKDLVNGS
jgi:ATP-dependent RNA helicase SUPV3L1/SUV3